MSQNALVRRDFHAPMRWPHAGSDVSRPGQHSRCAVRSLIRSKHLPRYPLHASNLARVQTQRPNPVGVTPILKLGPAIKSP